jgi:hypothetical protein
VVFDHALESQLKKRGEIAMVSDQERLDAWRLVTQEVTNILEKLNNFPDLRQAVTERIDQIQVGIALMKPDEDPHSPTMYNVLCFSHPETALAGGHVKICLHFSGDFQNREQMRRYFEDNPDYGRYVVQYDTLTLRMDSGETYGRMACTLIHELGHRLVAKQKGLIGVNINGLVTDQERLLEEATLRTFDCQLMFALGGPSYKSLVEEMAFKFMRYRTRQQKKPPRWEGAGSALDWCWGPLQSNEGKMGRDFIFRLYSELMAIDKYAPAQIVWAEKCKLISVIPGGY